MPIDSSIALGVRPPALEDPAALQAKQLQLRDLMAQGQAREMQMQQAQRAQQEEMTLADLYRTSGGDAARLRTGMAERGLGARIPAFDKQQADLAKTQADAGKTLTERDKAKFELVRSQYDAVDGAMRSMLADPQLTPDKVIGLLSAQAQSYRDFPEMVEKLALEARNLPNDPARLKQYLMQKLIEGQKGKEQLDALLPKTGMADAGNRLIPTQTNPLTGEVTQGQPIVKAPEGFTVGANGGLAVDPGFLKAKQSIASAGRPVTNIDLGQKGFDNALKLRGDFKGEPIYKAQQEMQSAYGQISQSLKQASPAGDLAGATKLMKLLDPGSVVRESELGMAMQASGLLDRLSHYATNVISGTKLTPTQRKDFQNLADKLYSESVGQYNAKRGEYIGMGQKYGFDATDAVGPEVKFGAHGAPAAPKPGTPNVLKFDANGNPVQ